STALSTLLWRLSKVIFEVQESTMLNLVILLMLGCHVNRLGPRVCGTDGKIYGNLDALHCEIKCSGNQHLMEDPNHSCNTGPSYIGPNSEKAANPVLEPTYDSTKYGIKPQNDHQESYTSCMDDCSRRGLRMAGPVCGNDGKKYHNPTELYCTAICSGNPKLRVDSNNSCDSESSHSGQESANGAAIQNWGSKDDGGIQIYVGKTKQIRQPNIPPRTTYQNFKPTGYESEIGEIKIYQGNMELPRPTYPQGTVW
ncbi:hypothetical protein QAD02_004082, partial [Eretmocerus hayati]